MVVTLVLMSWTANDGVVAAAGNRAAEADTGGWADDVGGGGGGAVALWAAEADTEGGAGRACNEKWAVVVLLVLIST